MAMVSNLSMIIKLVGFDKSNVEWLGKVILKNMVVVCLRPVVCVHLVDASVRLESVWNMIVLSLAMNPMFILKDCLVSFDEDYIVVDR